jgi:hypothetical protein
LSLREILKLSLVLKAMVKISCKPMSLTRFVFCIVVSVASLLAGCLESTNKNPNVIVIAVEGLGFDAINCVQSVADESSELRGGFDKLCAESVRFTHAFTPSVMSQATMASLLTAQYPSEHGLTHNGSQYLSETLSTLPEKAVAKGFRTAFFSGGPPIWRKSGIDQGFELFEDNVAIRLSQLYRPASQNINLFFRWLDREISGEAFLSFLFFPDLQFPMTQTVSDIGVTRSLTEESQLAEIDESLDTFITEMKKRNLWDRTNIVLLGTNGIISSQRRNQIRALNLNSENTQVTLMIKPARSRREESVEWSIDSNVSLVDLGLTLHDLVGVKPEFKSKYDVTTLTGTFERPTVSWPKDRVLQTQSAWSVWRGLGEVRMSLRREQYLFIYDSQPKLYNSLIDRTETSPLVLRDSLNRTSYENFYSYILKNTWQHWVSPDEFTIEKVLLASQIFSENEVSNETQLRLGVLVNKRPWEKQIVGWLARLYIQKKDWDNLLDLGVETKNRDWIYLARRQKGQKPSALTTSCLGVLIAKGEKNSKDCKENLTQALSEWVTAKKDSRSDYEEKFFRLYLASKIEERIAALNYRNGLLWDTVLDLPKEPTTVDLALWLPEFKAYRQTIERRMAKQTMNQM